MQWPPLSHDTFSFITTIPFFYNKSYMYFMVGHLSSTVRTYCSKETFYINHTTM